MGLQHAPLLDRPVKPVRQQSKQSVVSPPAPEQELRSKLRYSLPSILAMQCKLAIGRANDPFEAEADAMAANVMSMHETPESGTADAKATAPVLQRQCACAGGKTCEKCADPEETLRRKAGGDFVGTEAPAIVEEALRSPGMPLDAATRNFFEPRFGSGFGHVRVHADALGAKSAQAVGALAYTVSGNIAFANGEYAPESRAGRMLLAHELAHVLQQEGGRRDYAHNRPSVRAAGPQVLQREPKSTAADSAPVKKEATGPYQQIFIVRDKGLQLGGELVGDLSELKSKLMAKKIKGEWTLVLGIHGSEDRLAAQAYPHWQDNAIYYRAADIEKLFDADKAFVKWKNEFGPVYLSLVACQVSRSFEATLISNLTRPGAQGHTQPARGLGKGCKPIATSKSVYPAPPTRAAYDKLPEAERDQMFAKLKALNEKWGYYGEPPVPESRILDYYYSVPQGQWVIVEVMQGTGHTVEELTSTGIPFWNRGRGTDSAAFADACPDGVVPDREHIQTLPDVPGE